MVRDAISIALRAPRWLLTTNGPSVPFVVWFEWFETSGLDLRSRSALLTMIGMLDRSRTKFESNTYNRSWCGSRRAASIFDLDPLSSP
jgi:hypothetical protein